MVSKHRLPQNTNPRHFVAKNPYFQAAMPAVLSTLAAGEASISEAFEDFRSPKPTFAGTAASAAWLIMLREIREADAVWMKTGSLTAKTRSDFDGNVSANQ